MANNPFEMSIGSSNPYFGLVDKNPFPKGAFEGGSYPGGSYPGFPSGGSSSSGSSGGGFSGQYDKWKSALEMAQMARMFGQQEDDNQFKATGFGSGDNMGGGYFSKIDDDTGLIGFKHPGIAGVINHPQKQKSKGFFERLAGAGMGFMQGAATGTPHMAGVGAAAGFLS